MLAGVFKICVKMKDIAEKLGVSINAVSLALNNKPGVSDELRHKILAFAHEAGYLAKRNKYMKTYKQSNICVMMQKIYSKDMSFYGKVLYAVTEASRKKGYDTIIHFFYDDDFILPNAVKEYRVSGVIIIGKISDKNIDVLEKYQMPIVVVDHDSLKKKINCVLLNNKLGGYIATNYLIDCGLEKIGFFGDLDYSLSIKERFFGYQEALKNLSLEDAELSAYRKKYSITKNIEKAVLQNDEQMILSLLKMHKNMPQGFVCSNDYAAIALMMGLQKLGYKIPQDISIVGFDNIDMTERISPKITTINVDKKEFGKKAVERLCQLINTKTELSASTILSVELIEKASVKTQN